MAYFFMGDAPSGSDRFTISWDSTASNKKSPLSERADKEITLDLSTNHFEDQGLSHEVVGFCHLRKQLLKTNKKWYMVDLGLRNHILPRKRYDLGFSVENIVYFELLRRGYKVNIGKIANAEVDFVAQKQSVITYFQVTADMQNETTFEWEMASLRAIRDNYEKIVLTLDRLTLGNYEGIKVLNLVDWLTEV